MDQQKKKFADISTFLADEIEPQHADLLLFTCCLTSGLVDSTIYNGAIDAQDIFWQDASQKRLTFNSIQYFRVDADRYDLMVLGGIGTSPPVMSLLTLWSSQGIPSSLD